MFYKNSLYLGISPAIWINDSYPFSGQASPEQMLSETVLAGFEGTEIKDSFPENALQLKNVFSLRHLSLAGLSTGIYGATHSYADIAPFLLGQLKMLAEFKAENIIVRELSYNSFRAPKPLFGSGRVLNKNEWNQLCKNLDRLGKLAASYGIRLCFQPHICTVIRTQEETVQLMENTDERYVKICLDTGNFADPDRSAEKTVKNFGKRIGYVYLSDIRREAVKKCRQENMNFSAAVGQGCFTVPGDGCIDFQEVFRALDSVGYSGWVIVEAEQNPQQANPFEYALKAYHYLQALLEMQFPASKMHFAPDTN